MFIILKQFLQMNLLGIHNWYRILILV